MKIVVIGGSGLIGSKVVACLNEEGHEAVAASPDSGVDTLSGEGLAEALQGASVVIDVTNSPSFEDGPVLEFFTTSTTNQLAAEADAGLGITSPVHCRHGAADRKRLHPGEDRPGEADHGERDPVLRRPRDAVLRVRDAHRG